MDRRERAKPYALVLVIALILVLVMAGSVGAQLADSAWPMFHHDLNYTPGGGSS